MCGNTPAFQGSSSLVVVVLVVAIRSQSEGGLQAAHDCAEVGSVAWRLGPTLLHQPIVTENIETSLYYILPRVAVSHVFFRYYHDCCTVLLL